jgi:hypothetical protein
VGARFVVHESTIQKDYTDEGVSGGEHSSCVQRFETPGTLFDWLVSRAQCQSVATYHNFKNEVITQVTVEPTHTIIVATTPGASVTWIVREYGPIAHMPKSWFEAIFTQKTES